MERSQHAQQLQVRRTVFLLALVLLFVIIALFGSLRCADYDARLRSLKFERMRLSDDIAALREELEYSKTDDFVERIARNELGYIRPGELRFVAG